MPETTGTSAVAGLRVPLVVDLPAPTAELGNPQVLTALVSDDPSGPTSALECAAGALGIHPLAARAGRGDTRALLGGPVDVHMVVHGAAADDRQTGLVVSVGDARMRRTGDRGEETGDPLAGHGHDPLAVQLALMSFPIGQPADLTDSVLTGAHQTAGDWRRRVARWAERPSAGTGAPAQTVRGAVDDLDTASAIALLRGLADDDGVPEGAEFETFLYVDRVLGLDLARDIGKPG